MRKEVATWKKITGHLNIVKYYAATVMEKGTDRHLLILSELCPDGHLLDLLEKYEGKLSEERIILVMRQVVDALLHMHDQTPSIAHRDIKVENILMKGARIKLCDFGSASAEYFDPSYSTEDEIDDAFENYEKYTTFMYRPPEMLDKFSKWEIGPKVDCWMLGCVLFAL